MEHVESTMKTDKYPAARKGGIIENFSIVHGEGSRIPHTAAVIASITVDHPAAHGKRTAGVILHRGARMTDTDFHPWDWMDKLEFRQEHERAA